RLLEPLERDHGHRSGRACLQARRRPALAERMEPRPTRRRAPRLNAAATAIHGRPMNKSGTGRESRPRWGLDSRIWFDYLLLAPAASAAEGGLFSWPKKNRRRPIRLCRSAEAPLSLAEQALLARAKRS